MTKHLLVIGCALGLQAALISTLKQPAKAFESRIINTVPYNFEHFQSREVPLDQSQVELLQPDEYLSRLYVPGTQASSSSVFVGYFQATDQTHKPHSPNTCLPGAGWKIVSEQTEKLPLGTLGESPVRSLILAKGNEQIFVQYWYQTANRTAASETALHLYSLLDSPFDRRGDLALCRVITPITTNTAAARRQSGLFTAMLAKSVSEYMRSLTLQQ